MSDRPPERVELLADLNSEQRAAVLHTGKPLLVIAGPGSGKTRVIAHRIAYRVQRGVEPRRVVALTFTNRAATELRGRIGSLLGEETEIRAGTFHWLCGAILRRHAARIGFRRGFTLLTPREARSALRESLSKQAPAAPDLARVGHAISAWKNGASCEAAA